MYNDELLTVDEVAKLLKVSKMTVYRYINDGKLPAYKLEQKFRVKSLDLEKYLSNRKIG